MPAARITTWWAWRRATPGPPPHNYAPESADMVLRLWHVLKARVVAEQMSTVYETLERPLVSVLARMERRGMSIDPQVLSRVSGEFAQGGGGVEAGIPTRA